MLGSRILKKSAALTAVSTTLALEIEEKTKRTVTIISNGLDPLDIQLLPTDAIRNEAAKGPYILCVGRLEPLKGFSDAIRLLAELRKRGRSLRLLFAGSDNGAEGELRNLAIALALQDSISFLGRVPREQLGWLYSSAAVVLVTSITESFSLVTLEAMSVGAPCVASSVGGILDIVSNGENALLYPYGDVQSAVNHVESIITDPNLARKLSAGARDSISKFSWDRIAREYESVYRTVLHA